MKVYVVYEHVEIPDYNGNVDERTSVYGSLTGATDAVRTMFWDKMAELEENHHIDSDSLFVNRNDGYCHGVINYHSIGMNEYKYIWNISCTGYDLK